MKVWRGFESEHSANLVLVGEFETDDRATEAKTLIEDATALAYEELRRCGDDVDALMSRPKLSKEVLDFLMAREMTICRLLSHWESTPLASS